MRLRGLFDATLNFAVWDDDPSFDVLPGRGRARSRNHRPSAAAELRRAGWLGGAYRTMLDKKKGRALLPKGVHRYGWVLFRPEPAALTEMARLVELGRLAFPSASPRLCATWRKPSNTRVEGSRAGRSCCPGSDGARELLAPRFRPQAIRPRFCPIQSDPASLGASKSTSRSQVSKKHAKPPVRALQAVIEQCAEVAPLAVRTYRERQLYVDFGRPQCANSVIPRRRGERVKSTRSSS